MTDNPTAKWIRQLTEQVAAYIGEARSRGHGVQVVLTMDKEGKVGRPKVTITAEPEG